MNLASVIDHTLLKPDCKLSDIRRICEEAMSFQFKAVCIPPYYVVEAARALADSPIRTATVIGFPMGYSSTAAKVEEIKRALDDGADELDVVINLCAVKNGNWNYLQNDIDSMTRAVHLKGKIIKVILETGLLTEAEILRLCEICKEIQPNFVKTSTGFHGKGATVEMVGLLRAQLPPSIKIKASGGIRTAEDARQLLGAGADRLGASSGVQIVQNL